MDGRVHDSDRYCLYDELSTAFSRVWVILWTVNGWRGETDTLDKMKKRLEHDLYYILYS